MLYKGSAVAMAKNRRNAQIGLAAAVVLLAGCMIVLFVEPGPKRAVAEQQNPAAKVDDRPVSTNDLAKQ